MLITEFRIPMPMTTKEYQVGQLFAVADMSKQETGGGDGVEVVKNEPFHDHPEYGNGQYTFKRYYLQNKVPKFIKMIAPAGSLVLEEEAWNAFPYCRTILKNPAYMKDNFFIEVCTWHYNDRGEQPNVHKLPPEKLKIREVKMIDIANDHIDPRDYDPATDPTKFHSVVTGRGPLGKDWIKTSDPIMTSYKLVSCEFKWWGLQSTVESFIMSSNERLHRKFHRTVFALIDKWHGMTMEDVRKMEEDAKNELEKQRREAGLRGVTGDKLE